MIDRGETLETQTSGMRYLKTLAIFQYEFLHTQYPVSSLGLQPPVSIFQLAIGNWQLPGQIRQVSHGKAQGR
jgi:hypothetical protein